jgi:hypothetical protein
MARPWVTAHPELVEDVRKSLEGNFRNLHLFIEGQRAEIRGSFPVMGADGRILDRYFIRIVFPDSYPNRLPSVQEVAGRVPRTADRHVFTDTGHCCVLLEDARWESFPVGASFRTYLEVPLHNYFLGQTLVEQGEPWPFKGWGHGALGIAEYYAEILKTEDLVVIRRFVGLLALSRAQGHNDCFCGSGKRLRGCCRERLELWRGRIPPTTARVSKRYLDRAVEAISSKPV